MTAPATMLAWGVQRPNDVIELAASVGLPLELACAVLEKESGGGANVWGHDGVNTGGIYIKGAPVTREAYLAYKARRSELGSQGVGPMQLTYYGYQDQADAAGGAWDPRANMRVGFGALAALVNTYGRADGVRRYNGSGPAADAYSVDVLGKAAKWATRIGGEALFQAAIPQPRAASLTQKDFMIDNIELTGTGSIRLIVPIGRASIITARAWLSVVVNGPSNGTVHGWFQSDTGGISDFSWTIGFRDGHSDRPWAELPDGTTQINLNYQLPEGGSVCIEAVGK